MSKSNGLIFMCCWLNLDDIACVDGSSYLDLINYIGSDYLLGCTICCGIGYCNDCYDCWGSIYTCSCLYCFNVFFKFFISFNILVLSCVGCRCSIHFCICEYIWV